MTGHTPRGGRSPRDAPRGREAPPGQASASSLPRPQRARVGSLGGPCGGVWYQPGGSQEPPGDSHPRPGAFLPQHRDSHPLVQTRLGPQPRPLSASVRTVAECEVPLPAAELQPRRRGLVAAPASRPEGAAGSLHSPRPRDEAASGNNTEPPRPGAGTARCPCLPPNRSGQRRPEQRPPRPGTTLLGVQLIQKSKAKGNAEHNSGRKHGTAVRV